MKTLFFALVIGFSVFAQAAQLEAIVSCNCSQWVYGKNGMTLVRAHAGILTMPVLSADVTKRILTQKFAQADNTMLGYASITPGFAKVMTRGSIFAEGDSIMESVAERCKTIAAEDAGYVNCAVSITFPINEEAREQAK
jgi:hypothetical protein